MPETAPAGLDEAVEAVKRTGATVIGFSHYGERPNCSDPGEWWINVDFPRDESGWEIMDKINQAIESPPPGAENVSQHISFYLWSDAGLRFTITADPEGDPLVLASTIDRTMAAWENGW